MVTVLHVLRCQVYCRWSWRSSGCCPGRERWTPEARTDCDRPAETTTSLKPHSLSAQLLIFPAWRLFADTHLEVLLSVDLDGLLLRVTTAAVFHRSEDRGGNVHIIALKPHTERETGTGEVTENQLLSTEFNLRFITHKSNGNGRPSEMLQRTVGEPEVSRPEWPQESAPTSPPGCLQWRRCEERWSAPHRSLGSSRSWTEDQKRTQC